MELLEQKILLIEDNPGDVLLIRELLRNSIDINYRLITTDSIKESEMIAKTDNPDVLLVDLAITDSKGINTFYKVKELFHDKPIIVLSGNNDFELSNVTVKQGAQDYLVKGNFTYNTLIRTIQYAIERNKLELAIKEGEEKFRLLADNVPMFIWMTGRDGSLNYVNKRFSNYLGIEQTQILQNNFVEFINYEDRINRAKVLENAYKNKIGFKVEYKLRGKNGEYIRLIEKAVPNNINPKEFCGFIGSCLDITEIKLAEKELEEGKIKYKFIAQNSTDVIWTMDTNFNLKYISPSIKGFLGYSVEDFLMLKAENYLAEKSIIIANVLIQESMSKYSLSGDIKDLKTERIELEFITADGERKIENALWGIIGYGTEEPIEELDEETTSIYSVTGQIIANANFRKESEEQLVVYSKELEEINKSKDRFYSMISHDLKSPFQGLLGFASFILNEIESLSQDEIKEFVTNIETSAKNLFNLIENTLNWTRFEMGRIQFNPEAIDLYSLQEDVYNLLKGFAFKKNIDIISEIPQNFVITADKKMITSIFSNLITNAIKFTENGGQIIIKVSKSESSAIITFEDNGVGMSEEKINSLFNITSAQSSLGTNNEKGTGLGLILCKEMVETHGGTIEINSKVNSGTKFTISIPQ